MANQSQNANNPKQASDENPPPHAVFDCDARSPLERAQLDRWADIVATGEELFPPDLCEADQNALLAKVARRRRSQLVKFVAHAIARDIHRATGG